MTQISDRSAPVLESKYLTPGVSTVLGPSSHMEDDDLKVLLHPLGISVPVVLLVPGKAVPFETTAPRYASTNSKVVSYQLPFIETDDRKSYSALALWACSVKYILLCRSVGGFVVAPSFIP